MRFGTMRKMFFHDAPADNGGELENIKKLGDAMGEATEKMTASTAKVDEIANELATLKTETHEDVQKVAKDAAQMEMKLASLHGKSGARDFMMDFAKFLRGAYMEKIGAKFADDEMLRGMPLADYMAKAAVTFTTTTNATAGYLVDDVFMTTISELRHAYGNFYPLVTKTVAPPGVGVKISEESVKPVALWGSAQGALMTEEATPMAWGQDTITSELMYVLIYIANEMLANPTLNFSAVSTVRMLTAMNRLLEFEVIAGTTGGGAPSDGIIADATDQGTMASMTFANLITFLQDCITDNEAAEDTALNKIFMTRWNALALAGEQGTTNGSLVWGDAARGIPDMLMGYELVTHPAFNNGTARHVVLGDPSLITLVEDSAFGIDMSEHVKFDYNKTALRVINHHDWNLGITSQWHKKVITA